MAESPIGDRLSHYLSGWIHLKLRRKGRVENVVVYIVLGVDLEGHRDILGHWLGDGAESANFWLSVVTDLQARGVEDIFIACIDGLTGFKEAIHAVFPNTEIQRCIIHQIPHSLQYVSWKDRKAFVANLKAIYQASTREEAESHLLQLGETWGKKYVIAVKSWENNWEDLATFFAYPAEIRRLIYTTNAYRRLQSRGAQGCQNESFVFDPRSGTKVALSGQSERHPKVDDAHSKLGAYPEPTGDSV